jgi:NAD(P)-dependent dehydrogenase (short-subunit alcohol dehydrogenase family)
MSRHRFDLAGRTVFISGPARGIGAETARQLARKGANLALAGLEPKLLAALSESLGERAAWFEVDVRDATQLHAAVTGTVDRFGGIDVVIANAGIAAVGTLASIDPAEFEDTIQVNLLGVWRTIRAALPSVVERHGYVLAMASLAAVVHLPMMAAYAAAKAGVSAMADSLRLELERTGTRVGVAYFGFIDTDMTRDAMRDPAVASLPDRARRALIPKPLPVRIAGSAIVRGIEQRKRWIVAPRYGLAALAAPAIFQRLAEATARRAWMKSQ